MELKKLAQAIGHDEETTKKIIRQMMDRYEKEDRGIPDHRTGSFVSDVHEKRDV